MAEAFISVATLLTMDTLLTAGEITGALTAIAVCLYGTYKYIIEPWILAPLNNAYLKQIETYHKVSANFEKMEEALPILIAMQDEFRPNGGSSLRDSINRIEEQLKIIKKSSNLLMDHIADVGYFETDGDGNCVWANEKYLEIVGKTLPEILEKGWISSIHIDDRDIAVNEWYASIEDNRPFSHKYRYVRPDESVVHAKVHAVALYNKNGVCIGAIGVVMPCPVDCPCTGICPLTRKK